MTRHTHRHTHRHTWKKQKKNPGEGNALWVRFHDGKEPRRRGAHDADNIDQLSSSVGWYGGVSESVLCPK
jgi:hypothetical protein